MRRHVRAAGEGESLDAHADAAAADVLRPERRPHRHEQDAGRRARTSCRPARTTSTRACRWPTSRASPRRYGLNSRLVKRDGKLVEEVYKIDGRYGQPDHRDRRSISRRRIPFATEPMANALRGARSVVSHRRGRGSREATTSPGCRTKPRRSTRSTASSRSISIPAASRAAGRGSSSTSTRRRRRGSRSSPRTRSGSRIACRGIRSIASRTSRASSPTRSTS